MTNYINKVHANLFDGILSDTLDFQSGLNYISGENGTAKSRLLEFVKANVENAAIVETSGGNPVPGGRVAFYNPKRSAQKRDIQGLLAQAQREGRNSQTLRSLIAQNYSDQSFVEQPALADLFVHSVDETMKLKNKSPTQAVKIVEKDLKTVIGMVMPQLEVRAKWQTANGEGEAILALRKYGRDLTLSQLSVGENEIIALALSIYLYRDGYDLYLIDEPEVHLNWSLEKQLFDYLDWFANKYKKQVITVTHSPVVFEAQYVDRTNFLSWEDEKIVTSKVPSEKISNNLASRVAATFITIDAAYEKTFFVEDSIHRLVVEKLASIKSKNVRVVVVGDRSKVINLHMAFDPQIANAVYMVDGDNDDSKNQHFTGGLFATKKYCMENYLLDTSVLSAITNDPAYDTVDKVKGLLLSSVAAYSNSEFKKRYKAHIELSKAKPDEFFKLIDTVDGSVFISGMKVYKDLGFAKLDDFVDTYIKKSQQLKKLDRLFGEITTWFS